MHMTAPEMVADAPSTPRVSVITIFYNAETYLAEAIESVLAQDYRDFEFLLVDDGSTDRSTANRARLRRPASGSASLS